MRQTYEAPRQCAPSVAEFDRLKGMNSAMNAYVIGYTLPDEPPRLAKRGSQAYAAWAAGVDNRRNAVKHAIKRDK